MIASFISCNFYIITVTNLSLDFIDSKIFEVIIVIAPLCIIYF